MWHVIARSARRFKQAQTVLRVAQIAGTMVVAEAPPTQTSRAAVHSGVRIDTNGTSSDGKGLNNKQVGRGISLQSN